MVMEVAKDHRDEAFVRTPDFTPDGSQPPGETLVRIAVSRSLLARRKSGGSNPLTSTPSKALVSGPVG
jgi:hypothetical protein